MKDVLAAGLGASLASVVVGAIVWWMLGVNYLVGLLVVRVALLESIVVMNEYKRQTQLKRLRMHPQHLPPSQLRRYYDA